MRHPSLSGLRAVRLAVSLFLALVLLPGALPVAADGRPQPATGIVRCTFEGINPKPNSSQEEVRSIIIAFRCFDAHDRLVLPTGRLFDVQFFVDGVARDFQRAGEFDTEVVFIEFPNGLATGVHTARVVVEGKVSFSWSFRVTGGVAHTLPKAGAPGSVAKTKAASTPKHSALTTCEARPFGGLIAACAPTPDRLSLGGL